MDMITEVRRQFREIEGLLEGKVAPDTKSCVDISTKAAIRQMRMPGALAIVTPVVVGFGFGAQALGGVLVGVTVAGVLMAIFMSNAGGARDNAKKSFEGGGYKMEDGTVHPKGSEARCVGCRRHRGRPLQGHCRSISQHSRQTYERRGIGYRPAHRDRILRS